VCNYYRRFWDNTSRLVKPRLFNIHGAAPSSFPRLDEWDRKRPSSGVHKCKCGAPDSFKCFLRTQGAELMGEARRDDGVKMLVDLEALPDAEESQ
jgi:hypothetical protein